MQIGVEVVALDTAEHLVGERVGQQHLERVGQVAPGVGEDLEGGGERLEVGDHVVLARVDGGDGDAGERVQRAEHGQQRTALLLQGLQARGEVGEDGTDVLLPGGEGAGEPVDAVEGVGDGVAVLVQGRDQCVHPFQHGADLGFAAAEGGVEFLGDGLELVDAAAVEEQREGAEDLLDLGVAAGAGHRDDTAVPEAPGGGLLGGGDELDVLLAEEAGLFQAGAGVGGQPHLAVDLHGDPRRPVLAAEFDAGDAADGDVVDLDRGLRDKAEDVVQFGGDRVRVGAEVGAAGQRQVLGPLEAGRGLGEGTEGQGEAEAEGEDAADAGGGRPADVRDALHRFASPFPAEEPPVAGSGSRGPPLLISLRLARPSRVRVSGL